MLLREISSLQTSKESQCGFSEVKKKNDNVFPGRGKKKVFSLPTLKKKKQKSFLVAYWVKDPALSPLWLGCDSWPGSFHVPQAGPKKKIQKNKHKKIKIKDCLKIFSLTCQQNKLRNRGISWCLEDCFSRYFIPTFSLHPPRITSSQCNIHIPPRSVQIDKTLISHTLLITQKKNMLGEKF